MLTRKKIKIATINVAGYQSFHYEMHRFNYNLCKWLDEHDIDILCLQEVKFSFQQLANNSQLSTPSNGSNGYSSDCFVTASLFQSLEKSFEFFWANCKDTIQVPSIQYAYTNTTDTSTSFNDSSNKPPLALEGSRSLSLSSSSGSSSLKKKQYSLTLSSLSPAAAAGRNGVATFARKGLTLSADSSPLNHPMFDGEGRVIRTDHEQFVLFNVYIHNDQELGKCVPIKMEFLILLREAMNKARIETGKPVILCGDFNMTSRMEDIPCLERRINLKDFLASNEPLPDMEFIHRIQKEFREKFDNYIVPILQTRFYEPVGRPVNSKSNPFQKYRGFVTMNPSSSLTDEDSSQGSASKRQAPERRKLTIIGTWYQSECESYFAFKKRLLPIMEPMREETVNFLQGRTYFGESIVENSSGDNVDDDDSDREEKLHWLVKDQNDISLAEMFIICKVILDMNELKQEDLELFAEKYSHLSFFRPRARPCVYAWLQSLLEQDGMIDSFVHYHGKAKGRYTCWNQYANERYQNYGSRIDYILVDKSLRDNLIPSMEYLDKKFDHQTDTLPNDCLYGGNEKENVYTYQAALNAATTFGQSQPAPFEGSGIPETSFEQYKSQFNGKNYTGLFYTPPKFTDHIGVTCYLAFDKLNTFEIAKDKKTVACRPHVRQQSIKSFFSSAR